MKTSIHRNFTVGDFIYTITVLEGNHGGWLFVALDNKTIWEQSGYGSDFDKALADGKQYAFFDAGKKMGYLK